MPNLFKPDLEENNSVIDDKKDPKTNDNEKSKEVSDDNFDKEYHDIEKWDDMNLLPEILRGIYSYGYRYQVLFKRRRYNLCLMEEI